MPYYELKKLSEPLFPDHIDFLIELKDGVESGELFLNEVLESFENRLEWVLMLIDEAQADRLPPADYLEPRIIEDDLHKRINAIHRKTDPFFLGQYPYLHKF
ncbi:MAG: hypothetical protein HC836_30380 [Richelia sp. RM2_1_2]|nr:hypothetical protein [Richelia sp. RM2_1_2]